MPRKPIDYSITHFYKIVCKDIRITDCYIGHTTDFKTREGCHKRVCNNPNSNRHHCKIYRFIRENGGWDNFDMILIKTLNCQNALEARKKEREIMENHNATLNHLQSFSSSEEKVEQQKQWYIQNRDEVKSRVKTYKQSHIDKYKEYQKKQYQNNRETRLDKMREYYETHSVEIKTRATQYYEQNKERLQKLRMERYYRQKALKNALK